MHTTLQMYLKQYKQKIIPITESSYSEALDLEVFDCIKDEITNSKHLRIVTERENIFSRVAKKLNRRELRKRVLSLYTEEQLISFANKTARRTQESLLTAQEYSLFCHLSRKLRKNARKSGVLPRNTQRITYENYIKSRAWEARRNKFWQTHPKRCAICDTAQFIHLHHMDYSKMGREPDNHLVALCADHHAEYHALYGSKRHMIRTTKSFIASKK